MDNRLSNHTIKKWYGVMLFIFANATDWMPIPVRICWSEKDCSSLRHIGADVDFRRPRRIIMAESVIESKLVMMKERRV